MSKDYTSTLNLPKTDFPMRANLPEREPQMLNFWEEIGLYELMLESSEGCEQYILHDGPPFSNGNIHMGTALNKCLKDFINKSKAMEGKRIIYIPGWDNHGLPIESAIIKKNSLNRKKMSITEFRNACRKFAGDYVDIQREQFKRLGVLGDWENPYLTMDPEFEACEVRVFGEMYKKGCIYKGLKPVYWCPHDETALAEAEVEYQTDPCDSVYVRFRVTEDNDRGRLSEVCDLSRTYFIIWTTTIWTLPGNLAIALNPDVNYSVVEAGGSFYIVAKELVEKTMVAGGITEYRILANLLGHELEFVKTRHPFLDRDSVVLLADYVTTDSGTGCVHTAPGFGVDDCKTCTKHGIETIVPVDDRGYQTSDAGKYAGLRYDKSNLAILADMKESGALFAHEQIEHEYPHCWRCKEPVIFRATPQWFCSVDSFKDAAVAACEQVQWLPAWGLDRITQMIRERADWCISRQRHWGLPIPVFYCSGCGRPVCTPETTEAVATLFAGRGSNSWYETEAADILPRGFSCPFCGGTQFTKETDTLDCWFDSGVTHFAVLENGGYHPAWPKDIKWPADMYLEGADQYRGWFQSSLLTAVGARGSGAPYRTVLTHGWTVDGEGHAMHKSLGNTIVPEDMIKKYGAELVRLWAASSDYRADVRVSDAIFKQLSEVYRKIRNTARILLANLGDFDPEADMVNTSDMDELDKWILAGLDELISECKRAYDTYEFHIVYHAVNNFCTINLSKLYIDITKDRVYTSAKNSPGRRSAQSAMFLILSALTRLIAPIISFTAEEIWQAMPHIRAENKLSVFLNRLPEATYISGFEDRYEVWNRLFDLRDDVMKALELARADKLIGKSLDAKVIIYTGDEETYALLESFSDRLSTVFIVSEAKLSQNKAPDGAFADTMSGISVLVAPADGEKCDRCWMYSEDGEHIEDGFVCSRCLSVIGK